MSKQYYHVQTGVLAHQALDIKKIIIGIAAVAGLVSAAAIPAFAASSGYCVSSANGCAQSSSHTVCSGHGAFGASMSWVPGDAQEDGGMGHETGPANSALCGN